MSTGKYEFLNKVLTFAARMCYSDVIDNIKSMRGNPGSTDMAIAITMYS
jgi:hypothetical protein